MSPRADRGGASCVPPGGRARRTLHPLPILDNLEALATLGPDGPGPAVGLLALDVSKRAIGLAGADAGWRLATPLTTIRRTGWAADLARLRAILAERDVGALVIGWPLNMDGSEGPRCQAVRAFALRLDEALGLPTLLFDERLTTFAAEEMAEQLGRRGRRRLEGLDALAASALLQDALDALQRDAGGRARPGAAPAGG